MTAANKINEDKPWSETDVLDLRDAVDSGVAPQEIADFMLRSPDEVTAKAGELGFIWQIRERINETVDASPTRG